MDNSDDLMSKIEIALSLDDEVVKSLSHNAYIKSLEYSPDIVIPNLIDYYNDITKRI